MDTTTEDQPCFLLRHVPEPPIEELRSYLQAFDFQSLFVEGLGWNHYATELFVVRVKERDYTLKPIAEKAGFAVYECDSGVDNDLPEYPVRRKIESEVAKRTFEHLIIFTGPGQRAQVWQWVKRESGKPAAQDAASTPSPHHL